MILTFSVCKKQNYIIKNTHTYSFFFGAAGFPEKEADSSYKVTVHHFDAAKNKKKASAVSESGTWSKRDVDSVLGTDVTPLWF